ncbi:MAG: energy transducer TonB [Acidihalobacter sp.]|uniref:energy transducer TonB n=1 Tax=Acidihalobacter sp. TaxID=1872108 RepID=UPI00307E9820
MPQAVTPPRSDAAHLNNPPPPYPSLSRRLREEGRVVLDVYILADGRVGEIRLRRSSGHPRLDEVALDAVRRWRYVPARRGDEPIPFWYVQPVDFRLDS